MFGSSTTANSMKPATASRAAGRYAPAAPAALRCQERGGRPSRNVAPNGLSAGAAQDRPRVSEVGRRTMMTAIDQTFIAVRQQSPSKGGWTYVVGPPAAESV